VYEPPPGEKPYYPKLDEPEPNREKVYPFYAIPKGCNDYRNKLSFLLLNSEGVKYIIPSGF